MPNQETQIKLQAEISASANGLVSALNQATSAINGTTGDWQTKFSQLKDSTSLISQSVKNLGDLMGKVDSADMGKLTANIGEVQAVFGRVQGEVNAFAQSLSELKNRASELNMPIEEYQQFSEAVKTAGLSIEEGEGMIKAMQERIREFQSGVPSAVSQFEKLGMTVDRVSSNKVSANFSELAQAIMETIPPTERATQVMDLFKASVDSTVAVSDQFNKVISKQDADFVKDKDVQSAINLSNTLDKLGEQIGKMGTTTVQTAEDNEHLFEIVRNGENYLSDLYTSYQKYADGLKNGSTGLLDASTAINTFAEDCKKALTNLRVLNEIHERFRKGGEKAVLASPLEDFQETQVDYKTILKNISNFRKGVQQEMLAVSSIMNQRIISGAPIDTKELEAAKEHVAGLRQAINALNRAGKDAIRPEIFDVFKEEIKEFSIYLARAENQIGILFNKAGEANKAFNTEQLEQGLHEVIATYQTLQGKFAETQNDMKKGIRVEVDEKEVNKLIDDIEHLKTLTKDKTRLAGLDADLKEAQELKTLIQQHNAEVQKGVPIWNPITRAISRVKDGIANMRRDGVRFGQTIRSWWSYMTHFKNTAGQATGELKNTGAFLTKSLMQILGMGSAVAVVAKAWQNVTALVKEYVSQLHEAEKAELYGNKGEGADDMKRVREKRDSEMDKMMGKLKEFADLYDSEKGGSGEARAKRKNLQDELKNLYGFEFKEVRGEFVNLDKQIADQLEELRKKQLKAIDSQIKANDKVREGVDEYIDSFDGIDEFRDVLHAKNWGGYFKMLGHTFTGDVNGANAIKEAQERATRASNENLELADRRRVLDKTDYKGEWKRIRQGKAQDEQTKAYEEQKKALDTATDKLNEWSQSLSDSDRQKNLRAIMDKYQEAVKGGVKEEEARKVAIAAIGDMLKKEQEAEKKKNEELLKAMDERIKAYKSAYKAYVEADKQVRDAKKEYAQTQKELADEAKSERIAKRRERLQKAMGRFGFSPYEGFKFDESSSERRERRRNAQIDASIADKMAKSQSGKRVTWTHSEKERLAQFNALQRKDKQLEASQKAMEAADKQKKAAEALQEAARAIREAMFGRGDAGKNLRDAGKDLREASRQRRTRSRNLSADKLFEGAKKGLTAKGIGGALQQRSQNYNGQLTQLHKDLQGMAKRVYVVR